MAAKKTAAKAPAKAPVKASSKTGPKGPVPKRDPIQVAVVEVRKDHYDEVPRDWPRKLLEPVKELVLRPIAERQRILIRPVSVEILAPASTMRELRKKLGAKFAVIITSTG